MNGKSWRENKFVLLAMLVMMSLMVLLVGCGDEKAATTKELPKKIVIGLDDDFPPMGFKDESGKLVGFDIEMAKEAAKRLGMDVDFKAIDWDSKEAELKSKHIDVLWNGLTITEERKKNILFSKPYLRGDQILVVRADNPMASKDEMAGKVIGVQTASSGEVSLMKDPKKDTFKEVKGYSDFVSAFIDLEVGRIDVVLVDAIVGRYLMDKKAGTFKALPANYGEEEVGIGMRLEDKALKDAIDGALKEMVADGTADAIANKWFGTTELLRKDMFK